MKKFLLLLLVFSLLLSSFVGCKPDDTDGEKDGDTEPEETGFTVTETYLPAGVSSTVGALFEQKDPSFCLPATENLPFMIMDELIISECEVKSITIPVLKTGLKDPSGNYHFTLSVVNGDYNGMKRTLAKPIQTYNIAISASVYSLSDNAKSVYKWIKIPLDQYEIKLEANQTLAFGSPSDTLFAAVMKTVTGTNESKSKAVQHFLDNWGVVRYYYLKEDDSLAISHEALFFDFELTRRYADEETYNALVAAEAQAAAEYAAKLAAVKAAYGDKYLSVLGDSISTFGTITNSSTYNPDYEPGDQRYYTNSAHQAPSGNSYKKEMMYWGKLAEDTGMTLDVVSAWSGSRVYGSNSVVDKEVNINTCNMLHRCTKLANGPDPDLILVYFGINDYLSSPSSTSPKSANRPISSDFTGNLYQRLQNKGDKTTAEVVGAWFEQVLSKAKSAGYDPNADTLTVYPGTTYTTWEAAYALSISYMLAHYDNPEIYLFTLVPNNYTGQGDFSSANTVIRALAEYFGIGLIDQDNGYREKATCHLFTYDDGGLHPNYKGHMLLERFIVETLYEDLKNK